APLLLLPPLAGGGEDGPRDTAARTIRTPGALRRAGRAGWGRAPQARLMWRGGGCAGACRSLAGRRSGRHYATALVGRAPGGWQDANRNRGRLGLRPAGRLSQGQRRRDPADLGP